MIVAVNATSTSKKAWKLMSSHLEGTAGEDEQGAQTDPLTFPAPESY